MKRRNDDFGGGLVQVGVATMLISGLLLVACGDDDDAKEDEPAPPPIASNLDDITVDALDVTLEDTGLAVVSFTDAFGRECTLVAEEDASTALALYCGDAQR